MAVSISSVKKEAKAALKGKYVIAIIASMAILFAFFIIQNIAWVLSVVIGDYAATGLMLLLGVLFCGPLTLGVLRCFWRMYKGLSEPPAVIFYYFSKFKLYYKAFKLTLILASRFIVCLVIFSIPSTLVYLIGNPEIYDFFEIATPIWTQQIAQLGSLLSLVALLITIMVFIKFYISPMLIVVNNEIEPDEALHMSAIISRSSFIDYIYLVLNMLHWIIISLLVIPLVFTVPYFIMAYVVHISHAIDDYNEKINKLNDANLPSFVAGV